MAAPKTIRVLDRWKGMRLVQDLLPEEGFAYDLLNMLPADPVEGGALVRRFSWHGQVGTIGTSTCNMIDIFWKRSGPVTIGVFAGEIYRWVAGAWTKFVALADFNTAGITRNTLSRWYAVTYTDKMVFTDGVNQPFIWDGSAGAGGLTLLTNAPVKVFGKPTIYYGKMFFIKANLTSDLSTIVWSEENAPNTGYEAGGFNNAWTLNQSGQGQLYAICGTNEALYYFRRFSIGSIRGAANSDFVNAGTHDDISGEVGTQSPGSVFYYGGRVYFCSSSGKPHAIVPGAEAPLPLWKDIADLWGMRMPELYPVSITKPPEMVTTSSANMALAVAFPVPYYEAVGFAIPSSAAASIYHMVYLFSTRTGRCMGRISLSDGNSDNGNATLCAAVYNDTDGIVSIMSVDDALQNGTMRTCWGPYNLPTIWSDGATETGGMWSVITPPYDLGDLLRQVPLHAVANVAAGPRSSADGGAQTFRVQLYTTTAPIWGALAPAAVSSKQPRFAFAGGYYSSYRAAWGLSARPASGTGVGAVHPRFAQFLIILDNNLGSAGDGSNFRRGLNGPMTLDRLSLETAAQKAAPKAA